MRSREEMISGPVSEFAASEKEINFVSGLVKITAVPWLPTLLSFSVVLST